MFKVPLVGLSVRHTAPAKTYRKSIDAVPSSTVADVTDGKFFKAIHAVNAGDWDPLQFSRYDLFDVGIKKSFGYGFRVIAACALCGAKLPRINQRLTPSNIEIPAATTFVFGNFANTIGL